MKNIDTGMGVERMAAILQGVDSVFETDSLRPLIELAEELSGRSYSDGGATTRAMRILADHARGTAALIADGVVPSNEDRGYVLRRIMRRAIQQGRSIDLPSPFMERFADRALDLLAPAYPELAAERENVLRWAADEEESFGRTLERGTQMLARPDPPRARGPHLVDRRRGRVQAPRHLRLPLRPDQGAARRAGALGGRRGLRGADGRAALAGPHGDGDRARLRGPPRGCAQLRVGGAAVALRRLREARAPRPACSRPRVTTGAPWSSSRRAPSMRRAAARWRTRARSAGRAATPGSPTSTGSGTTRRSSSTARWTDLAPGARVEAEVDHVARFATMRNHTATHLLHAALRERLGTHVRQAGSAVRPDKLRFDFTHGAPLTNEELRDVGDRVNDWIKESHAVRALEMSRMEAERLGAMALFGEKYGDWVRVVEVEGVSRELCGGTHVANTADDRDLRDRVRGVERGERAPHRGAHRPGGDRLVPPPLPRALRGRAGSWVRSRTRSAAPAARPSGSPSSRSETRKAGSEDLTKKAEEIAATGHKIGGITVFVGRGEDADQRTLLDLADRIKSRAGAAAVVLGGAGDGKAALVASFSKEVTDRDLSAADVIREAAQVIGGGGGGRENVAQAGGRDPAKLDEALAAARKAIEAKLTA